MENQLTDSEENVLKSEGDFFLERDIAIEIIKGLCSDSWKQTWKTKWDVLVTIFTKYQEQPTILGPYMEEILLPLTNFMVSFLKSIDRGNVPAYQNDDRFSQFCEICKVIQLLCRVRGFKHVIKHFPHEVNQLEPCILLLQAQNKKDFNNWEMRYILFLWLSVLCLMPFDICSFDSSLDSPVSSEVFKSSWNIASSSLVKNIVELCQDSLSDTGPTRESASCCLSALLTRPDMESDVLSYFMNTSCDFLVSWTNKGDEATKELSQYSFRLIGTLLCMSQIFKKGHRKNLLPFALIAITPCTLLSIQQNQTLSRKLVIKLYQRIGITLLVPRVPKWRYQRGNRSLLLNLQGTSPNPTSNKVQLDEKKDKQPNIAVDLEDDFEVPPELEEILGQLLGALQDKDTVVRWSAAKGIGRIAMGLPKRLVDDVVGAILEMFHADSDSESAWHGGCLSLAELCRRGLLMPDRLVEIVPIVSAAMHFDVLRGQHSVGANVRDAACFVCWAFARAYSPEIMKPFVKKLSDAMLLTALYDREINCRRAASAALQENVGRQGNQNFPHGIEIISLADFFSLSNRSHAYLRVSLAVAGLHDNFHTALVEHLSTVTVSHWDEEIRVLASRTLGGLTTLNPQRMAHKLEGLIEGTLHRSVSMRHGAVLAVAEILLSLRRHGVGVGIGAPTVDDTIDEVDNNNQEKTNVEVIGGDYLTTALIDRIVNIVPQIEKARLYRGKGGEALRVASCHLIECIAKSYVKLATKSQVVLVEALNENLRQPHERVQQAAVSALRVTLYSFFSNVSFGSILDTWSDASQPSDRLLKLTTMHYVDTLRKAENVALTRGCSSALGVLPLRLLVSGGSRGVDRVQEVMDVLDKACRSDALVTGDPDAETRRNSVNALTEIGLKLLTQNIDFIIISRQIKLIFDILLRSCDDYGVDKRGDIGSWIRVAALKGLEHLLLACLRDSRVGNEFGPWSQDPINAVFTRFQPFCSRDDLLPATLSKSVIGWHVDTFYGIGIIRDTSDDGSLVHIAFPPESLGHEEAVKYTSTLYEDTRSSKSAAPYLPIKADGVRMLCSSLSAASFTPLLLPVASERKKLANRLEQSMPQFQQLESGRWNDIIDINSEINSWRSCVIVDEDLCRAVISAFLKQLSEKLDWVRGVAGAGLSRLVASRDPLLPCLGSRARLETLVGYNALSPKDICLSISWTNPADVYSRLVRLLSPKKSSWEQEDHYFAAVLSGLVVSLGGLSESVVKESSSALLLWCKEMKDQKDARAIAALATGLLQLLQQNARKDRIIIPTLRTVELLLKNGVFDGFLEPAVTPSGNAPPSPPPPPGLKTTDDVKQASYADELLSCIRTECARTGEMSKLRSCVDVLVLLLGVTKSSRRYALKCLVALLEHRFPRIRRYAAEQLYLQLLIDPMTNIAGNDGGPTTTSLSQEESEYVICPNSIALNKVIELLTETIWDAPLASLQNQISELRLQFGLPPTSTSKEMKTKGGGSKKSSTTGSLNTTTSDELESYEALVKDAGRPGCARYTYTLGFKF